MVDAAGLLVLPGLIDLHTHVFHDFSYWGVDPDLIAHDSGVTTWVDAGSAGALTLRGFRRHVVRRTVARIRAFVNISYRSAWSRPISSSASRATCDVDLLGRALAGQPRFRRRDQGPDGAARPSGPPDCRRCIARSQAASGRELPVMVHIADAPPEIGDVLDLCCGPATSSLTAAPAAR